MMYFEAIKVMLVY